MRKINTITAVILCLAGVSAYGESLCPDHMEQVRQQAKAVSGFETWADPQGQFQLKWVMVYDGPPSEMASLVPDVQTENKMEWDILPDANNARKVWIACGYQNTNLSFIQQLPDATRSCVVTLKENITIDGMPAIDKVECE